MVRPVAGKAGQTITFSAPSALTRASATGPMLPCGVESKVEQYLKKNWRQPCSRSHSSASSDCATACSGAMLRVFNATTPASTPASAFPRGTPQYCVVAMPFLTSVLARSDDPVKSSPMQPSSMLPVLVAFRRQVDAALGGVELDQCHIPLAPHACGGSRAVALERGLRNRQVQLRAGRRIRDDAQILDEDVDRRMRPVVAIGDVGATVPEHP